MGHAFEARRSVTFAILAPMPNRLTSALLLVATLCLSACATAPQPEPSADDDLAPEGPAQADEKSAQEVCAAGAGDMCSALADHTFRRAKTDADRQKALSYALKGCELKDGAGCSLAGWAYEWGSAPDLGKALSAYEQGCAVNDGRSCLKAATLLSFGPVALRDRQKAKTFATTACSQQEQAGCDLNATLDSEPRGTTANDCGKKGEGALSKAAIRDVIRWHGPEVRDCFSRAAATQPALAGRIELSWVIDCSGAVTKPAVAETSLPAPVNECVLANVKRWRFPAPQGGGSVNITFPWVFKPTGTAK